MSYTIIPCSFDTEFSLKPYLKYIGSTSFDSVSLIPVIYSSDVFYYGSQCLFAQSFEGKTYYFLYYFNTYMSRFQCNYNSSFFDLGFSVSSSNHQITGFCYNPSISSAVTTCGWRNFNAADASVSFEHSSDLQLGFILADENVRQSIASFSKSLASYDIDKSSGTINYIDKRIKGVLNRCID